MDAIITIYIKAILRGTRTFNRVPDRYKEAVRQILIESGYENLVTDD